MRKIFIIVLAIIFFGNCIFASENSVNTKRRISVMDNNRVEKISYNNIKSSTVNSEKRVKPTSVAGTFYTSDREKLEKQIGEFKKNSRNTYKISTRAVIVPHAGLVYSGRLAYEGISQLDKNIKNIFIIAPAHRMAFDGLALTSYDAWKTPLGEIDINREITEEIVSKFGARIYDEPLAPEHSIEVEIPFVQTLFKDVNIIPILIGKEDFNKIYEIINYYYKDPKNGFIISSDLSHYLPDATAKKVDAYTAQLIETGVCENFSYELACGAVGILGLLQFSNENEYSLIRIDMSNSSETSFDKNSVVGYGCWFLNEGSRDEFIKSNYSDFVLNLCKNAIKNKSLDVSTIDYPKVLSEYGAVFVTLEKEGRLRGCIGSVVAHRPLIEDIVNNARNAAYSDPRFKPVEKNEIKDISIAVSILSVPKPISFKDEDDLLNQIRQNVDGMIIKDNNYQAVYLPSVWEQIPDKKEFLNSLKVKAGLPADYFSKTFKAYRFESVYIK